jgi:tetratricopeptide (TPR) repeat protein/serine/threonine protein kinase
MVAKSLNEQAIFEVARKIDAGEARELYVRQVCGDDEALDQRIRALLSAYEQSASFLEAPPSALDVEVGITIDDRITERPGAVIGPYKLMEQIGEGGMGLVFVAEQQQPVRRMVALKVIKPGMDSHQVIARFEAERQALALMDHSNIAKVHDGGETAGGRPYFVMELVKGIPITQFCDDNRLSPRDRLELFVDVCRAVQHAHHKGIIHRDIKPSNVLVTSHDGPPHPTLSPRGGEGRVRGVVKVIDFGVAKAIGQQLTDMTVYTHFAQLIGTPLYMSPEQAGESSLDVDTRSDIYSLGVLLYELLTGTTPFDKKRLREVGYDEMRRIIREEEPPRPSTRISTLGQAATTLSTQRKSDPKRLSQLCRGELDWIVMKALDKDRNRRYETASTLAADVQRYLHDEPVQACPPSLGYRVRKFVRRNKGSVLAASVMAVLLLGGIVGTTTGLVLALAAERRAVTERDDKEEARRQARQALDTMTDEMVEDLLGQQVQLTDQHREFLKKVLEYHAAFAATKADDPEGRQSRAQASFRVGRIRFRLGDYQDAGVAYRDAVAQQIQLVADFPTRPEFQQELADSHVRLGDVLTVTNHPEEAEAAYRSALALWQRLVADFPGRTEFHQELANSHIRLGLIMRNSGGLEEAETAYRAALAIRKQLVADFGARPQLRQELSECHFTLGELLSAAHRPKEAEAAYNEALRIRRQLVIGFPQRAEFQRSLATNHVQLGWMYWKTNRRKEAEDAFRVALALAKQQVVKFPNQPEFRLELALCHQNLGVLLGEMHQPEEAETAFQEALAICGELARAFPDRIEHRLGLAMAHLSLGTLLSGTHRPEAAEAAYDEALPLYKQLAAEQPNRTEIRQELAQVHVRRGKLLRDTNRPKEAEAAFREAIAVGERLAADYPKRAEFRYNLALSHFLLGDLFLSASDRSKEAEAAYRTGLALWKLLPAEYHTQPEYRKGFAVVRYNLANALRRMKGRLEEAIAEYREAIRLKEDYPQAQNNLGLALKDKGDLDGAIAAFREAIQTKDSFPNAYMAHSNLGSALRAKGCIGDAITAFRESIRINPDYADAHYGLGNAYFPKRLDDAIAEYREAIRINPDYAMAYNNLGNSLAMKGELEGAIAEFRRALQINKDLFEAHCNLGSALQLTGLLKEAIVEYREAVRVDKNNAEAQENLRQAEQLGRLDERLPAVLQGKDKAKDADESLGFAQLCERPYRQKYAAAAGFYKEAFAAKPSLADDNRGLHRYDAACVAAQAGCGQGTDADKLDDKERACLRRQALDWSRGQLEFAGHVLDKTPDVAPALVGAMQHWLDDSDFAGVRGPEALAKLPEDERQQWQKLWIAVSYLLKRAQEKATPEKK